MWSITGEDAVTERIIQLVKQADERVVYGSAAIGASDVGLLRTLDSRCGAGVDVSLVREPDQSLPTEWTEISCLTDHQLPSEWQSNDYAERMLVVDSDVFLFSIRPQIEAEGPEEIAIWSARTTFATAFVQLMIGGFPDSIRRALGTEPPDPEST
ncbi:hypothetical protein ACFQJD_10615 [Haloplanus sp. GCM10025708]|uniref:hypothetical protein n=1 Tax=Haloplanus sp. GCM10025708 TaxID=3252679 RepID=UPI003606DB67